jgi:hypothetical protein
MDEKPKTQIYWGNFFREPLLSIPLASLVAYALGRLFGLL